MYGMDINGSPGLVSPIHLSYLSRMDTDTTQSNIGSGMPIQISRIPASPSFFMPNAWEIGHLNPGLLGHILATYIHTYTHASRATAHRQQSYQHPPSS